MLVARIALVAVCAAAAAVAQAGTAKVAFVDETHLADAGSTPVQRQETLRALSNHLEMLARRDLPADQVLKVDFLDVDLAGHLVPATRAAGHPDLRVLRGRADVPRIVLRYTLESGGHVLQTGTETLTDLDYLNRRPSLHEDQAYFHEKRLLTDWFRARFVKHPAAEG